MDTRYCEEERRKKEKKKILKEASSRFRITRRMSRWPFLDLSRLIPETKFPGAGPIWPKATRLGRSSYPSPIFRIFLVVRFLFALLCLLGGLGPRSEGPCLSLGKHSFFSSAHVHFFAPCSQALKQRVRRLCAHASLQAQHGIADSDQDFVSA